MSYTLCLWDAARHPPLPANAADATDMMDRLEAITEDPHASFVAFGAALVERYQAETHDTELAGLKKFYGVDPRASIAACTSAVYRISLPLKPAIVQRIYIVEAAAQHNLVVYDDEDGHCFLPDGTIFPEDGRAMWEWEIGPPQDSRTLLQKVAGELFDVMGRDNKHRH